MLKKNKIIENFEKSTSEYFKEISGINPLSQKEEVELWRKYKKNNDIDARNKLVLANLKFVANVAKKYQGRGLSYSDLIAEGNIGLIRAMDKFDAERGYKAISYSVWWIRQSILEALSKRNNINGDDLPYDYEEQPLDDNNEKEEVLSDCFLSDTEISQTEQQSAKDMINELTDSITEREREIVESYYGLNGEKPQTLEEIGNTLHLTKERIRQLLDRAMLKMRSEAVARF